MSAGVAERPLVGRDLSITGCMGSSGDGFGLVLLAQTVTSELQSVSIVDNPVEDGVGQGRLANQVVPAVDGDLAGDQRGATAEAVEDKVSGELIGAKNYTGPHVAKSGISATLIGMTHVCRARLGRLGDRSELKMVRRA